MSRKRGYCGDQLTGGSGDVNPQYIQCVMDPATPGNPEEWQIMTPYSRMARTGQHVTIMEVLSVTWEIPQVPVPIGAVSDLLLNMYVATRPGTNGEVMAPGVIDSMKLQVQHPTTVLNGASVWFQRTIEHNLSDSAGHGILVGTDAIWLGSSGTAAWHIRGGVKIMYRFKTVGLQDYIGIVTAQFSG